MFEIAIKHAFTASHALTSNGKAIEEPHEHRFECEARLESDGVSASGMAIDFRSVDEAISRVIAPLRDANLHEAPMLEGSSPSAENLAQFIYSRLTQELGECNSKVTRVAVWEDPDHCATYYENSPPL